MTLHDCMHYIMRVSASSWVAHSEVTSWPAHDTTLFASKKPPLMPISLPTSRVYWINWFDRKDYAPHIFCQVHNVLPVLLNCVLWHDIPWNHVWWSVLCICQIRHPPWYRHWTSLISCFEWRYLLNRKKLKHPWVCQCCIYINSIPLMIVYVGNVVGGNVGHDMPSSLSWIVLSWDLFVHLILPFMFAKDNEKSGQSTFVHPGSSVLAIPQNQELRKYASYWRCSKMSPQKSSLLDKNMSGVTQYKSTHIHTHWEWLVPVWQYSKASTDDHSASICVWNRLGRVWMRTHWPKVANKKVWMHEVQVEVHQNIMKTWDTYQAMAVIFTSAIWYNLLALVFTWMKYLNFDTIYWSIFVINDNSQLTIIARILVLNGGGHLGFHLILPLYSFLSHNWICIIIYNTIIFFGKNNPYV